MKMEEQFKRLYQPTDEMRTNHLSVKPGGSIVRVVFDSHVVDYDKIKYPSKYIDTLLNSGDVQKIMEIYVDGKLTWKKN